MATQGIEQPHVQRPRRKTADAGPLTAYLFMAPYLVLFTIFIVIPVVFGIWISLHNWDPLLPVKPFVGLQNYGLNCPGLHHLRAILEEHGGNGQIHTLLRAAARSDPAFDSPHIEPRVPRTQLLPGHVLCAVRARGGCDWHPLALLAGPERGACQLLPGCPWPTR